MTFANRAAAGKLKWAWAFHLDIADDPITVWTGPGVFAPTGTADTALNGKTFDSVGSAPALSISPVTDDDRGVSPLSVTLSGADLNADGAKQFLRDRRAYQGRRALVWVCLLDEEYQDALAERYYTGLMSTVAFQDGAEPSLSLTIDRDLRVVRTPPRRLVRQKEIWPNDTFADFVTAAANGNASPQQAPPTQVPSFNFNQFQRFNF